MKLPKEILQLYGRCCVSEHVLMDNRNYPAGEDGKEMSKQDTAKIENLRGQKKAIEWLFE